MVDRITLQDDSTKERFDFEGDDPIVKSEYFIEAYETPQNLTCIFCNINRPRLNKKMKLKEAVDEYVPPETLVVSELEYISVEEDIFDGEGVNKEGTPFKYKYLLRDKQEYRVPLTVLGAMKTILKAKPSIKAFKIVSEGKGLNTKYQAIALDDEDIKKADAKAKKE